MQISSTYGKPGSVWQKDKFTWLYTSGPPPKEKKIFFLKEYGGGGGECECKFASTRLIEGQWPAQKEKQGIT